MLTDLGRVQGSDMDMQRGHALEGSGFAPRTIMPEVEDLYNSRLKVSDLVVL